MNVQVAKGIDLSYLICVGVKFSKYKLAFDFSYHALEFKIRN